MSPALQTFLALGLVALAVVQLVRSFLKRRHSPGCGAECGAVSPAVKKLRDKLPRH